MNKSDMVVKLAQKTGMGLIEAEEIVDLMVDQMRAALTSGKRIEIRGFGSFVVKDYDGYTGRNPKTGEHITVGSKKLPAFKLGKELRDRLNGESEGETR